MQIAAALDAKLARELEVADPQQAPSAAATPSQKQKKGSKSQSTADTAPSTASVPSADGADVAQTNSTPTVAAAAGQDDPAANDAFDDGAGVQLFRSVPKGAPCVIQQDSIHAWEPLGQAQHQQQQGDGGSGFGSGSLARKQPLRDQIPRLSLAESSRQGSKRKHQEVLEALAVDGTALQAAAVAAGYTCTAATAAAIRKKGLSGSKDGSSQQGSANGSSRGGSKCSNTAGWVKGWRRLKGQKVEGVVKEAKEWVPYDVRAAKLLGTATRC